MRLKHAIMQARFEGVRYIQRHLGNTLFDVISYRPDLLDQEDIVAGDWCIPFQEQISYLNRSLRAKPG